MEYQTELIIISAILELVLTVWFLNKKKFTFKDMIKTIMNCIKRKT